jgi:tetratricopeptide (TPR) repeat protein
MQSDADLTESDKAQMYYYFAYIDSINEDLKSAKRNYIKFLSIEDADPRLKSNVISMLGQLSYSEGNYKTAIDYMEQWISMEANPSSLGFDIIAASYWQLKDKKKALKFSERALCVAKANKSKPKESTYNLLIALYNENQRIKDMLPLFEELVRFYPKKRYWTQLSGVYGELKEEKKQLSSLEAAHDQRLLDKGTLAEKEFTFKSESISNVSLTLTFVSGSWFEKLSNFICLLALNVNQHYPFLKKNSKKIYNFELTCLRLATLIFIL